MNVHKGLSGKEWKERKDGSGQEFGKCLQLGGGGERNQLRTNQEEGEKQNEATKLMGHYYKEGGNQWS